MPTAWLGMRCDHGHPHDIPAEFKATCLAFLEEVAELGAEILSTKRGGPVARLGMVDHPAWRPSLAGRVRFVAGHLERQRVLRRRLSPRSSSVGLR